MRLARRARSAQRCRRFEAGRSHDARQCERLRGPIIVCLLVALQTLGAVGGLRAQSRELQRFGAGAPEAKLMLYYSSTVAFSPVGRTASRIEAAVEVSFLPPLSAAQRTIVSDKPESTNLALLFARPRLGARLPGGFGLELSWIPPVRLFDVKPNLFAGAVSRSFVIASGVRIIPRASFLTGRVEGSITCNREATSDRGVALATYFTLVCYGNNSRDFFEPRHVSGELVVATSSASGRWEPYVSAGARAERTRFDIGVIHRDGTRDRDEPVLEVRTTRAYGTAGASWLGLRRTRLAAELYYAPGSALTARALAGVHVW